MIKKIIKKILGVKEPVDIFEEYAKIKYQWANDESFNHLYSEACARTQTKEFFIHKMRSYTLLQFCHSAPLNGKFAECGVFKGTTAYQLQKITGKTVHLFDSFEGISPREIKDAKYPEEIGTGKGDIACSIEQVQINLGLDGFEYHKGWIPEKFKEVENMSFSFVHVDVDVYQPTRDAFDFFYPRMVLGGIIICDDYGFRGWPGAKKAVDEMAEKYGFKVIILTTGQCMITKIKR